MDKILAKQRQACRRTSGPWRSAAAGFVQFAGGDQARARRLLKQSLPLYRQAGDRLGMGLTAAALGHLLAARHQAALASDLLEQTLSQLQEMAGRAADRAGARSATSWMWPWHPTSWARSSSTRKIITARRSSSPMA